MSKRPKDMWGIIRHCDPEGLGRDWLNFAYQYCDASEGMFGLEADGGSNLEELNERLRKTFMVRRIKAHVLKELPPKTRQVIVLPPEGLKKLIKSERDKFTDALAMLDAVNEGIEYNPKQHITDLDPGLVLDTMTRVLKDFDREGLERSHDRRSRARLCCLLGSPPRACPVQGADGGRACEAAGGRR
jgi:hypothetical protein